MSLDLEPAARQLADLVRRLDGEQLDAPTPCEGYRLGDLVEHIGGLAQAFTLAAAKEAPPGGSAPPAGDAARLAPDWQARIPHDLEAMARAWQRPEAWTGMTQAGGIDLPGEVAGVVALDELVVHGWDVARATGQPFAVDPAALEAVQGFVARFAAEEPQPGLFGRAVPVPEEAPLLDRVIGLTGRDPAWSPTR